MSKTKHHRHGKLSYPMNRKVIARIVSSPEVRARLEAGAIAREHGYERWAEEILQIADTDYTGPDGTTDSALVQQARLRVDSRKWLLSKMLPHRYGDKLGVESSSAITVRVVQGLGDEVEK